MRLTAAVKLDSSHIIFTSKTHSQLKHAMKEFKRTKYHHINSAIIVNKNAFSFSSYRTPSNLLDMILFGGARFYYQGMGSVCLEVPTIFLPTLTSNL